MRWKGPQSSPLVSTSHSATVTVATGRCHIHSSVATQHREIWRIWRIQRSHLPVHIGMETCRQDWKMWMERWQNFCRGTGTSKSNDKSLYCIGQSSADCYPLLWGWGGQETLQVADTRPRGEGRSLGSSSVDCEHFYRWGTLFLLVLCSVPSVSQSVFTITEKAPTRAFSWLKTPTSAFTFKTLLRHYA